MFQFTVPILLGQISLMTQRLSKYLRRRGATYQLRIPIPKDLHAVFDRKELRWSLRTKERSQAENRALRARLVFLELCDSIRYDMTITKADIKELVVSLYARSVSADPPPVAVTDDYPGRWHGYQQMLTDDFITDLEAQRSTGQYDDEIIAVAKAELLRSGMSNSEVNHLVQSKSPAFSVLCGGVARAKIEHARFIAYRRTESLLDYQPKDELFHGLSPTDTLQSIAKDIGSAGFAPTIEELIDTYIDFKTAGEEEGNSAWKSKDLGSKRRALDWYAILAGRETPADKLSLDNFREYRDLLPKLRKNAPAGADMRQQQAKSPSQRISAKTANQYFHAVKSFLKLRIKSSFPY